MLGIGLNLPALQLKTSQPNQIHITMNKISSFLAVSAAVLTVSQSFAATITGDITFTGNLGAYTYIKEGKFLGTTDTLTGTACAAGTAFVVNGCFAGNAPVGSAYRHLILGITQPIGSTPLTWGAQAILGGKNRYGIEQDNKFVLTLSYGL